MLVSYDFKLSRLSTSDIYIIQGSHQGCPPKVIFESSRFMRQIWRSLLLDITTPVQVFWHATSTPWLSRRILHFKMETETDAVTANNQNIIDLPFEPFKACHQHKQSADTIKPSREFFPGKMMVACSQVCVTNDVEFNGGTVVCWTCRILLISCSPALHLWGMLSNHMWPMHSDHSISTGCGDYDFAVGTLPMNAHVISRGVSTKVGNNQNINSSCAALLMKHTRAQGAQQLNSITHPAVPECALHTKPCICKQA